MAPSKASVASALSDFGASTNFTNLLLGTQSRDCWRWPPTKPDRELIHRGTYAGPGLESWPVATVISVMVLRTQMVDCVKAAALADWLYWTQTSALASQVADHFGQTVASTSSVMQKVAVHHPHNTTYKYLIILQSVCLLPTDRIQQPGVPHLRGRAGQQHLRLRRGRRAVQQCGRVRKPQVPVRCHEAGRVLREPRLLVEREHRPRSPHRARYSSTARSLARTLPLSHSPPLVVVQPPSSRRSCSCVCCFCCSSRCCSSSSANRGEWTTTGPSTSTSLSSSACWARVASARYASLHLPPCVCAR